MERENVDRRLYIDAHAYATLHSNGNWGKGYIPIYQAYGYIPKEKWFEGNELRYIQAVSFTAYLIDNYSLDQFLEFCKGDKSFEYVFGITYNEAKDNWLAYLNRP